MQTIKKILTRNWFGLLLAVIACAFLFQTCQDNNRYSENLKALTEKNAVYKNKLGTLTTVNKTLQLTQKELKQTIAAQKGNIKVLTAGFYRINTVITTQTITKLDTIVIPFEKPIPCEFDREGTISQEWFSLGYKLNNKNLTIDSVTIPNEQIIVVGLKRKNMFSKSILVTEITNTNPKITTTGLTSYETVVPVKWYESKTVWATVGAIIGFLIAK